jgi:hypothetical protein
VPEIIDRVFAKTSQNTRFLLSENERFGLVFVKTGSITSGTGPLLANVGKALNGRDLAKWLERFTANQCQSRNGPVDPSILRHSRIWVAADKAVLNKEHEKIKKIPMLNHLPDPHKEKTPRRI